MTIWDNLVRPPTLRRAELPGRIRPIFTVKGNQRGVLEDVALWFQDRKQPDFVQHKPPNHGRIETRKIWTTTELNGYLNFPHVGQAFLIERHSLEKKSGLRSCEIACGITSQTAEQANPRAPPPGESGPLDD